MAGRLLIILVLASIGVGLLFAGAAAAPRGIQLNDGTLAQKGDRVALVIGNAAYKHVPPLSNTVNDASIMADALKDLGFELVGGKAQTNLDKNGLDNAIRKFGETIRGKRVAFLYYSGHGVQVDGKNYLIPTSANVVSKTDAKYELVNVDNVLDDMNASGTKVNIIVLDACRNNPFGDKGLRGMGAGLASMDAPTGTIVAYATGPGKTAADGTGKNSPYTEALAKIIEIPGLSIEDVFREVGKEVQSKTGGAQIPWKMDSLTEKFYFKVTVEVEGSIQETEAKPTTLATSRTESPKPDTLANTVQAKPDIETTIKSSTSPSSKKEWKDPTTVMEFVWVAGGTYMMGCGSWAGDCKPNESPEHEVTVNGFWIAKYVVTQEQYQKVMGSNPSGFRKGGNYPVETLSWEDAKAFIQKLNSKSGTTFRLPTEAEWEYAARSGGKPEKYAGGNDVDVVAWYVSNSGRATHPVGTKAPNGLGLYDMSGNVWQWCEDTYDEEAYKKHQHSNPISNSGGSFKVLRGGSWSRDSSWVRCTFRGSWDPVSHGLGGRLGGTGLGLRLVRTD